MDQIFADIGKTRPACFQHGMSGIGWGIEYLVQHHFVEANTDDVLSELDEIIFNYKANNSQSAFFGQGFYFLSRIEGHERGNKNTIVQKNKEKLIIYTNDCEDYINTFIDSPKDYPDFKVKYHLSMLYFLLELKRLRLFEIKAEKLMHKLYKILIENPGKLKQVPDHLLVNWFMKRINTGNTSVKVGEFDEKKNQMTPDEIIEFPFMDVVYNIEIASGIYRNNIQNINIQELIEHKTETGENRNLGLQNGLAGLGMALMKANIGEYKKPNYI